MMFMLVAKRMKVSLRLQFCNLPPLILSSIFVLNKSDEEAEAVEEQKPSTSIPNKNKKTKKPTSVDAFKSELNGGTSKNAKAVRNDNDDEYKNDSSDEEDIRNTIGNVPMHWYDEYKHIGYDWDAKKIIKPARRDQLDDFLKRMEDPNFWRTVKDMQTGQDIVISEADIAMIKRINSQRIPDEQYDDYAVGKFFTKCFHFTCTSA